MGALPTAARFQLDTTFLASATEVVKDFGRRWRRSSSRETRERNLGFECWKRSQGD